MDAAKRNVLKLINTTDASKDSSKVLQKESRHLARDASNDNKLSILSQLA